jgi:hypothetical protein
MNHLRLWCSGKPDGETDTCLLEFAIQVASNVRSTQLRSAAAAQGVNVRGLAVSAVGELFGSSGPNSPLGRALMGYLDDDATGIARFKATIVTRTTQFAHSQLELNDPNGYRIMRNLRLSYKRHPRLRVGPVGECTHVMLTGTKNLNKEGLPWPVDELVKIICKHAQASACIGDWLVSVLEEVSQDNERQAFVRTSEIEAAFRLADSLLAKGEMLSRTDDEPVSAETKHAVANAITLVSHEGRARLDRFLERGRIDTTAHNRLNLALQDMIQDISHDGEGGMSRYEYVSRHWPDLDKETYTTLLKSPFQTVVEHMYSRLGEVLGGNSK